MGWQTQVVPQLQAGDTVINANGIFTYSGTPAAGNLILSSAPAAGTDPYGNQYLSGATSYGAGIATQIDSGQMILYTGTLAGGWTLRANILISGAIIELITSGGVITSNNTLDNGSGGATFNGIVTFAGAQVTTTNGLTSGQINGTSGAASAGTAHTHGGGTYAVANGQHHHNL